MSRSRLHMGLSEWVSEWDSDCISAARPTAGAKRLWDVTNDECLGPSETEFCDGNLNGTLQTGWVTFDLLICSPVICSRKRGDPGIEHGLHLVCLRRGPRATSIQASAMERIIKDKNLHNCLEVDFHLPEKNMLLYNIHPYRLANSLPILK